MKYIEAELRKLMNDHKRTGSLASKELEIKRLVLMVKFIYENHTGVKTLKNIGRRQIFKFYGHLAESGIAESTIYKYGLAVSKLWDAMGFGGEAPKPKTLSKV